jgi:hypothetical protein
MGSVHGLLIFAALIPVCLQVVRMMVVLKYGARIKPHLF